MSEPIATEIIKDLQRKNELKANVIKAVLDIHDADDLQKIYDFVVAQTEE